MTLFAFFTLCHEVGCEIIYAILYVCALGRCSKVELARAAAADWKMR